MVPPLAVGTEPAECTRDLYKLVWWMAQSKESKAQIKGVIHTWIVYGKGDRGEVVHWTGDTTPLDWIKIVLI